jgi:hypothetical protein
MTTSRVPAVIDYLVATFQADVTLGKAPAPGTVNVIDGPAVTADPGPLALWVGVDDIDPGAFPAAASSTQQWAALGHMARNESLTITCVAQAQGGDDVRTLRVAAAAIVSAVEDLVRGDVSLGGNVSTPGNAAVTAAEWRQGPSARGMSARVTFQITAQARIGG